MIDPVFLDLMQHYVDFQKMNRGTSAPSSYGHKTLSRDTVDTTYADVRVRVRSLTSDEIETTSREGEVTSEFVCYIPFDYLPTDLRKPKNAVIYRVMNVRTIDMVVVDAGPFDIQGLKLMAGEQHHYQCRLLKIN